MNSKVVLSIIIPLYNGEKFIERTVKSILSQPSTDYEIIIVNDGSVDNSICLITKLAAYSSNIQIISIKNKGVGFARNLGIEIAKGMFYLFVDQDDFLLTDSFNNSLVNRLKKYYIELVDVFSFRFVKCNASISRFYTSETYIEAGNADSVYMISGLPIHFSFYHSRLFKEFNMRFEESKFVDLDMQFMHILYYRSRRFEFDNNLLLYCWVIHQESAGHNGSNLIPKHYDAIRGWKKLEILHKEEGDNDAAKYCHSYMCGVFLSFLREYYKTRLSYKPIYTLITDLEIEEALKNLDNIDNQSTVDGLSEYYSHKALFIIKARLEKYKHSFGIFAVNRNKFFNNRYMIKKYPLSGTDLNNEHQAFVERLDY